MQDGFNVAYSVLRHALLWKRRARMYAVTMHLISNHCLLLHITLWSIFSNCPILLAETNQIGNNQKEEHAHLIHRTPGFKMKNHGLKNLQLEKATQWSLRKHINSHSKKKTLRVLRFLGQKKSQEGLEDKIRKSQNTAYLRNMCRRKLGCFYSIVLTGSRAKETNFLKTLGDILPKAKMSVANVISLL